MLAPMAIALCAVYLSLSGLSPHQFSPPWVVIAEKNGWQLRMMALQRQREVGNPILVKALTTQLQRLSHGRRSNR